MGTVYSTLEFLERWKPLSLAEKIGHLGSEITRARVWEEKGNHIQRDRALERALELIDATLALVPNAGELAIMRDVVIDICTSADQYNCPLTYLENYCLPFALLARKNV